MTTLKDLGAPYDYVQMEEVVAKVEKLLELGQAPSGTGTTSVYMVREESGAANLLRLKGLGSRIWQGTDAQDYIDKLRSEWAD